MTLGATGLSAINQIPASAKILLRVLMSRKRCVSTSDRVMNSGNSSYCDRKGCKPFPQGLGDRLRLSARQASRCGNTSKRVTKIDVDPNEWLPVTARDERMRRSPRSCRTEGRSSSVWTTSTPAAGELLRSGVLSLRVCPMPPTGNSGDQPTEYQQGAGSWREDSRLDRPGRGDPYGNPGSPDQAGFDNGDEWVYPGSSFFTLATIRRTAAKVSLAVTNVKEYTAFVAAIQPDHCHD